jgi:hypothetical protein
MHVSSIYKYVINMQYWEWRKQMRSTWPWKVPLIVAMLERWTRRSRSRQILKSGKEKGRNGQLTGWI